MICLILEQEAISYSETRGRVLPDNYSKTLRRGPHKDSTVSLGEHSGTTESNGDRKSLNWYVDYQCKDIS